LWPTVQYTSSPDQIGNHLDKTFTHALAKLRIFFSVQYPYSQQNRVEATGPGSFFSGTDVYGRGAFDSAKNDKRQTPQAPVRNRQTRKVANAKVRIG